MRFPATTEGHSNLTSFRISSKNFKETEKFRQNIFQRSWKSAFIFVPFRVVCDRNRVWISGPGLETKIQFRNQYGSPPIFISDTFFPPDTFLYFFKA